MRYVPTPDDEQKNRIIEAARRAWQARGYRVYVIADAHDAFFAAKHAAGAKALTSQFAREMTKRNRTWREAIRVSHSIARREPLRFRSVWALGRFVLARKFEPPIRFDKRTVLLFDPSVTAVARQLATRARRKGATVVVLERTRTQQRQRVKR